MRRVRTVTLWGGRSLSERPPIHRRRALMLQRRRGGQRPVEAARAEGRHGSRQGVSTTRALFRPSTFFCWNRPLRCHARAVISLAADVAARRFGCHARRKSMQQHTDDVGCVRRASGPAAYCAEAKPCSGGARCGRPVPSNRRACAQAQGVSPLSRAEEPNRLIASLRCSARSRDPRYRCRGRVLATVSGPR